MKRYINPPNNRGKFNTQLFQDIGTTELYQTTLQDRLKALQELHTPVEEHWNNLKNIWKETCLELVGKKKANHKPWDFNRNNEKSRRKEGKKGFTKPMRNQGKKGSSPQRLPSSKQGGEEKC
ncbi:hypothetical protein ABVT39_008814 [Epinephelus coioides]